VDIYAAAFFALPFAAALSATFTAILLRATYQATRASASGSWLRGYLPLVFAITLTLAFVCTADGICQAACGTLDGAGSAVNGIADRAAAPPSAALLATIVGAARRTGAAAAGQPEPTLSLLPLSLPGGPQPSPYPRPCWHRGPRRPSHPRHRWRCR
jgi:hypothetical protein